MHIIDQGTVVAGRIRTDMSSCCFPSLGVLESGRWLVACRAGPAKNSRAERTLLTWSDDQGRTWSNPVQPVPEVVRHNGRPGQWRVFAVTPAGGRRVLGMLSWEDYSDPFIPMFNETTEGLTDMRLFTVTSEDGGEHWSAPLPVTFGRFDKVPNPITGPLLLMPDGRWAAQFEVNKTYHDATPWQHHSALVFSSDHGKTWSEAVDTHTDPAKRVFCWDQRVAVMPGGEVWAMFWTFDRQAAVYLNMHAAVSKDSGRTWTPARDIGVPGQPARPVALPDGRAVLVYVDRAATPTIMARASSDGGKTWPDATATVIHKRAIPKQERGKSGMVDAWDEMSDFSVGLPDAVALPGGEVLTVFYTGPKADHTDIQWVRFRP